MPKPKVLALVMAGGEGNRLELLTERRAKPALPYAGVYRLIDFPLSNCVHSGIEDVWVLPQYRLQSLNDELADGRSWDLDRGVQVGPDARVGRSDDDGDPALIGEEAHVPRGATVAPGGRLGQDGVREPGT